MAQLIELPRIFTGDLLRVPGMQKIAYQWWRRGIRHLGMEMRFAPYSQLEQDVLSLAYKAGSDAVSQLFNSGGNAEVAFNVRRSLLLQGFACTLRNGITAACSVVVPDGTGAAEVSVLSLGGRVSMGLMAECMFQAPRHGITSLYLNISPQNITMKHCERRMSSLLEQNGICLFSNNMFASEARSDYDRTDFPVGVPPGLVLAKGFLAHQLLAN